MSIDKNLIQRSLAGIVFLAIMIAGICWDQRITYSLFALIALGCLIEFTFLLDKRLNFGKFKYWLIAFQATLVLFVFLGLGFLIKYYLIFLFIPGVILILITSSAVLFMAASSIESRMSLVGTYIFSVIYILTPLVLISTVGFNNSYSGLNFNILYMFILVWTNDTLAYSCGRLFGKHKLAESISPKKTIEGFVGGLIFTVAVSMLISIYWKYEFENPIMWWAAPILIGVFATIGDLFESAIKRWVDVKDSGNIIPGHGGILDRFDGALVAIWPYIVMLFIYK